MVTLYNQTLLTRLKSTVKEVEFYQVFIIYIHYIYQTMALEAGGPALLLPYYLKV